MSTITLTDTQTRSTEFENLVNTKARSIIEAGTAYNYILDVWKSRHFGAPIVGKVLLVSVGPGSISNSKGIHVQICGKAGSGKSDAAMTMAKLIEPTWMLSGSLTPQVLFYPTEHFVDSSIVFIDDMVWKSELGTNVKRVTSSFQEGAQKVVTTESVGIRQYSRKRLTFWVTSVDNQTDEQLRDRFIMVESDSSDAHIAKCLELLKAKDAGHTNLVSEDLSETAVCHALIRDIKQFFGEVIVPFAERISFKGDLRAFTMFMDMVKSFAVFAHAARLCDEHGRLLATEADFSNAVALFKEFGGHSADKYTEAELNFLTTLQIAGGKATRAEMCKLLGHSMGYVGDLLTGRSKDDQQKHGLFYKCNSLTTDGGRPYTLILEDDWQPVLSSAEIRLNVVKKLD